VINFSTRGHPAFVLALCRIIWKDLTEAFYYKNASAFSPIVMIMFIRNKNEKCNTSKIKKIKLNNEK